MNLKSHIVACLLLAAAQAAICSAPVSVQVTGPEPVSPLTLTQIPFHSGTAIRIAVALDGKPLSRAKVEFYRYELGRRPQTPTFTLLCDKYGRLKTSKLSGGLYELTVNADYNLQADLLLQVSSRYGNRPMAFEMNLRQPSPAPFTPDLAAAEKVRARDGFQAELVDAGKTPITDRLQVFRGVVTDFNGAVIPKVIIQLVERTTSKTKIIDQIKSGGAGEFEEQLPPGTYVAIFSAPGFKNKVVGFEISPLGGTRLNVSLDIAAATQDVTVE